MSNSSKSKIVRGKQNCETLASWVASTPIGNVPVNQYGRASRSVILKDLGISGSKDHAGIKEAFAELDSKLGKTVYTPATRSGDEEEKKSLKRRIAELEKQVVLLSNELSVYKKNDRLIDHLLETGRLAR